MFKDSFGRLLYEGEFHGNARHGKGILYLTDERGVPNGDRFEGDFEKGMMHGRGIMYYANGNTHEGEYRDDKRHGKGRETTNGGRNVYVGRWKEGMRVGVGKMLLYPAKGIEMRCRVFGF